MPKYRNPPTKYEIHCLKIEIHKGHEIHSKATLAKHRNPRNPQTVWNPHWQGSQQTKRQFCCCVLTAGFYTLNWIELYSCKAVTFLASLLSLRLCAHAMRNRRRRVARVRDLKVMRASFAANYCSSGVTVSTQHTTVFWYCHNCTVLIVLVLLLMKCANPRSMQSVCCMMMFFCFIKFVKI